MAKIIKRAGIIFFVLVISCLLIVGCALSFNIKSNDNNLINGAVDSESTADVEENYDFELTGNSANMAAIWKDAVTAALSTRSIKVKVLEDWTAPNTTDGATSFGEDADELAFVGGSIKVPEGADIELNLNGHIINRNLQRPIINGRVIVVEGKLTINGNPEGLRDAKKTFREVPSLLEKTNNIGKITGGNVSGNGGGIFVAENGQLDIKGGMILNNYASSMGGGICAQFATLNFYDGVVTNNTSMSNGGGIESNGSEFNFYDGIVANNYAHIHGGGISNDIARSTANPDFYGSFYMYGGSISYNRMLYGGLATYGVEAEIFDGEISYNQSWGAGAGITIWSGANTKIHGGLISHNVSEYYAGNITSTEYCGGGILFGSGSSLLMDGGEISYNTIKGFLEGQQVIGGGIGVYSNANELTLIGGVIKNNSVVDIESQVSYAGGVGFRPGINCPFNMGGNIQIYDNNINGKDSDLRLDATRKINITTPFTASAHIGIRLDESYSSNTFTNGYSVNNSNPSAYFFSNDGAYLATLNGGEVSFENTIESNVYDFVYIENGKRQNYKENNLTHAVNDYEKSMIVNNGKLILGNIGVNTSINTLIGNINFSRNHIKIYNNKNQLVYDKGNSVAGINTSSYDNGREFAVGTGWKIETYTDSGVIIETIYLSVLGDVNGDGRISASDCAYLRQIASDNALYESLSVEKKLASMVINKGSVTSADAEIVRNVVDKLLTMDLFF